MIPKIIHQFWVGPKKPPMDLIKTWINSHPNWEHVLWTESTLKQHFPDGLINQKHYDYMPELNGKCDIARYEILEKFGGFFLDADAICVNPLDEYLLQNEAFACYENELVRGNLIAAGYLGTTKNNRLMKFMIEQLGKKTTSQIWLGEKTAWRTVGPVFLTESVHQLRYSNIAVYPSFYFIPRHYTGMEYTGPAKIYAKQLWGSTPQSGFEYAD